MTQNIFDMIEVYFGYDKVLARPFQFTEDQNGNFIEPTMASTICPKCGHGVNIKLLESLNALCDNCGYGDVKVAASNVAASNVAASNVAASNVELPNVEQCIDNDFESQISKLLDNKMSGLRNEITIDQKSGTLKASCPFVDPLELGLFIKDEI